MAAVPEVLRAIVLRTRPYSETSLWVRLFTESQGRLSGIAKGARRGRERHYTPLIEIEVKGYPPRSDEYTLWNLPRPELISDWRSLTGDVDRMAGAWALLEVTDKLMQEQEPHPDLYRHLIRCIEVLHDAQHEAAGTLAWYLLRLTAELGYALQYELCPRCGEPLVFPVGTLAYSDGGVVCRRCSPEPRTALGPAEWTALVGASAQDPKDVEWPEARAGAKLITRLLEYLSFHADRPLQLESLKLWDLPGGP